METVLRVSSPRKMCRLRHSGRVAKLTCEREGTRPRARRSVNLTFTHHVRSKGTPITIHRNTCLSRARQLPIYPLPEREIVVVEQTSALEEHIGVARRHVQALYADAYGQVHSVVSRWIEVEHSIERASISISNSLH